MPIPAPSRVHVQECITALRALALGGNEVAIDTLILAVRAQEQRACAEDFHAAIFALSAETKDVQALVMTKAEA